MNAIMKGLLELLGNKPLRLSAEQVKEIAERYLSERSRTLPKDAKIAFMNGYNEWRVNLQPGMRPGRWISIDDDSGEVIGEYVPPR